MWYREDDKETHYADLSFTKNHVAVVGHTPQKRINMQNLEGDVQKRVVYCDSGKGNLQGFNLTTGLIEDIEMADIQMQLSQMEGTTDNLKIALGIINCTLDEIEKSVKERKPIYPEDIDIMLKNKDLLREGQKRRLEKILPALNIYNNRNNVREYYNLRNFQSQDQNIQIQTRNSENVYMNNPKKTKSQKNR